MRVIKVAPASVQERLLPKAKLIINFLGCDLAKPGAVVVLDGQPGEWLVCWVTPPCHPLGEARAGLFPVGGKSWADEVHDQMKAQELEHRQADQKRQEEETAEAFRKRGPFLLFEWDQYYPAGGPRDCKGVFNTLEEAEQAHTMSPPLADYYEIATPREGHLVIVSRMIRQDDFSGWRFLWQRTEGWE